MVIPAPPEPFANSPELLLATHPHKITLYYCVLAVLILPGDHVLAIATLTDNARNLRYEEAGVFLLLIKQFFAGLSSALANKHTRYDGFFSMEVHCDTVTCSIGCLPAILQTRNTSYFFLQSTFLF